jgi:hypothetical protein
MIDEALRNAIVKVERRVAGRDPVLLGTAFVVADELLLTARHVVDGREGDLRLVFRDRAPDDAVTVKAKSATDDWALLSSSAAKCRPIRLGKLPNGPPAFWQTFAYFRRSGSYLSGLVYGVDAKRIDLRADEVAFDASSAIVTVGGASGSPMIANGVAVGMVVDEQIDPATMKIVQGSLTALPMELVVVQAGAPLSLDDEYLPFEAAFVARLLAVPEAVLRLAPGLGLPTNRPPRDLAVDVSRALIRLGWEKIRKLLRGVSGVSQLPELAESLWVDEVAATHLRRALTGPRYARAAAINVCSGRTAGYYVNRAEARNAAQDPFWMQSHVPVHFVSQEAEGKSLKQKVTEALTTKSNQTRPDMIQAWITGNAPVVAIVTTHTPITDDLLAEMRAVDDAYDELYQLVLTGPVLAANGPQVGAQSLVLVRPELPHTLEEELLARYDAIKGIARTGNP